MWSSPRNVSTAMMYSWRQRGDTTVVDEPLYAFYLNKTGRDHPGFDEVVASQLTDGDRVISEVLEGLYPTPVIFFKQMAKHLLDINRDFLSTADNILLTRNPYEMLTSLQENLEQITVADTGFTELVQILDLTLETGREPIVVDSKDLLANPEALLTTLCDRLELPFDPAMLSWPPGPKPEDGVWGTHWYANVHKSTGWGRPRPKKAKLRNGLEPVLAESQRLYEQLQPYALEA